MKSGCTIWVSTFALVKIHKMLSVGCLSPPWAHLFKRVLFHYTKCMRTSVKLAKFLKNDQNDFKMICSTENVMFFNDREQSRHEKCSFKHENTGAKHFECNMRLGAPFLGVQRHSLKNLRLGKKGGFRLISVRICKFCHTSPCLAIRLMHLT